MASTVAIHHTCRGSNGAAGMPGSSGGRPIAGASMKTAKPARPQNKPWRHPIACPRRAKAAISRRANAVAGDDVRQQGEGVALEAVLRRPGLVLVGGVVVCDGREGFGGCRRLLGLLEHLGGEDQRHDAHLLGDGDAARR